MTVIGKGTPSYASRRPVERSGTSVAVRRDRLHRPDLESTIALVESGGTTFLSPILGSLGGVVCRTGRCARTWRSCPVSSRCPACSAPIWPRTSRTAPASPWHRTAPA